MMAAPACYASDPEETCNCIAVSARKVPACAAAKKAAPQPCVAPCVAALVRLVLARVMAAATALPAFSRRTLLKRPCAAAARQRWSQKRPQLAAGLGTRCARAGSYGPAGCPRGLPWASGRGYWRLGPFRAGGCVALRTCRLGKGSPLVMRMFLICSGVRAVARLRGTSAGSGSAATRLDSVSAVSAGSTPRSQLPHRRASARAAHGARLRGCHRGRPCRTRYLPGRSAQAPPQPP
jgi:hypothetical protein